MWFLVSETFVFDSDSQLRVILSPQGHVIMSGDTFSWYKLGRVRVLLVSCRQRPGCCWYSTLHEVLQTRRKDVAPSVHRGQTEKLWPATPCSAKVAFHPSLSTFLILWINGTHVKSNFQHIQGSTKVRFTSCEYASLFLLLFINCSTYLYYNGNLTFAHPRMATTNPFLFLFQIELFYV